MKPVPLGNALLELRTGPFGSLLHKADYVIGGIPLVNPMHISGGRVCVDQKYSVSSKKAAQLSSYMLKPGHIVMGRRGEIGRCAVISESDGDLLCGTGSMILVPNPTIIDSYYLAHLIQTPRARKFLESEASGATMLNLNPSAAAKLPVPLPSLQEQKRIAAILDHADELRRKRQRAIDGLNQLGQAIFHEMFGEWDGKNSNADTLLLGDHLDFLTSGSRGWAEYYRDSGGLFLRIQNVKRDELDLNDVAYVEAPQSAEARRTRVEPGDVLLSITADLGRTAVVPSDIGEAYINQHLAIIRSSHFNPRFLSAALSSPSGQRGILKRNREGVKAGLNFDDVRSVSIPKVPMETQNIFAKRLACVDLQKTAQRHALEAANSLFSSIQHRAFVGEL